MKALTDLFTTDYGLMSIAVILFTVAMAVFYLRYFIVHIVKDSQRARLGLASGAFRS